MTPSDRSPHLTQSELDSLLDGAMTSREEDAARRHLRGCAVCNRRLEARVRLFALIDGWRDSPPPRSLVPSVMEAIRPSQPPLGLRLATAVQAGLAILVAVAAWPLLEPLLPSLTWSVRVGLPPGTLEASVAALASSTNQLVAEVSAFVQAGTGWLQTIPTFIASGPLLILGAVVVAVFANSILLGGRGVAGTRRL